MEKVKSESLISRIYTSFIKLFKSKDKRGDESKNTDINNQEPKVKEIQEIITIKIVEAPTSFDKINALVVEDNSINRRMMQLSLKSIGISSDMAENGRVGYEMRTKNSYHIIFMDIQMPIMDGVEATKAILEYEKRENQLHVPIVAVTANALKGDREQFLEEGMDEYISKPIDLDKFTTVIKEFFPKIESAKKSILLYKQNPIETKIVSAILDKLGYSILVAETIDEFKKRINLDSYHCILLDRIKSDSIHQNISKQIKSKNIQTLLFVDDKIKVLSSDREIYTHITDKLTDFNRIKDKVESMMI